MNLLLKLKPLEAHLDAFEKTKSMTDTQAVKACIEIWDEWKNIPEVSLVIYNKVKQTPKTDMGCGSCVGEAIRSLVAWRNAQRADIPKISFKGVPDMSKPKAKVSEEVVETKLKFMEGQPEFKDGDDCGMTQERMMGFDPKDIESVKAHLRFSGIKYHHKMKLPALLALLNK